MNVRLIILTFTLCTLSLVAFAQKGKDKKKDKNDKEYEKIDLEKDVDLPDYLIERDTIEVIKKKKKKRKKKTFNKIKTKRGFTRRGEGKTATIETFFYLKKWEEPNEFIDVVYLYDRVKLKIFKLKRERYKLEKYPIKTFKVLHGPYKKRKGDLTLAEGYFYKGARHDKWFEYNGKEDMIVRSRKDYHKGFPGEYDITYYDKVAKEHMKKINPYNTYGENTGKYYYFYPSGNVKEEGKMKDGVRTGKWMEYHDIYNKRKRELQYTDDEGKPLEEPKVLREWNTGGKLVSDKQKKPQDKYYKQKF